MKKIDVRELGIAIAMLIIYMVVIPYAVSYGFFLFNWNMEEPFYFVLAYSIIYFLTFSMIFIVFRKSLKEEFCHYLKNIKQFFPLGLKYWGGAFVFMALSNSLIVSLSGDIATNEEANRSILFAMPVFSVISMAILGPIVEEMLFRKAFKKAFLNDTLFLVVTSLLFGGAHLISSFSLKTVFSDPFQLLYLIPYGGIGFFFAKAYLKTDTVFTSVVMHILHNSLSIALIFLASSLGV